MGLFSSFILFIFIYEFPLPYIDFPFVSFYLNSNPTILILILLMGVIVLCNGLNMIDGSNGILILYSIFFFLSIRTLSLNLDDDVFIFSNLMLVILLFQFFFNYVIGKIFCGDAGASFLGYVIGFTTISFFSYHPEITTWTALNLLFYPLWEVLFTTWRRFKNGNNIFKADAFHLHSFIHKVLSKAPKKNPRFLTLLWLVPIIISTYLICIFNSITLLQNITIFIFQIALYCIYWVIFSRQS